MSIRRISFFLLVAVAFLLAAGIPISPNTGADFVEISGIVRNNDGSARPEVQLVGFYGGTVTTIGDGSYSALVPLGWSGTVTPTLSDYAFDPYNRDYTEVASDQFEQDYTAYTAHIIVGRNVNMVPYPLTIPGPEPDSEVIIPNTGDQYLQRQNEPSIAVSTRNPLHLLAGANDYRTVDLARSEGPLPGIPEEGAAARDAWLGVFKSYNGGQSWTTTLLPGFPQEVGSDSPLYGYSTACDPTVRAGPSGLFFYSGIVFDRIDRGSSAIFVARYIDNNTQAMGDMDSIKYLDVSIIDEGTAGQFSDKPWIAVDAPDFGSGEDTIKYPGLDDQRIPRFNVYTVYSIFQGSEQSGGGSKIMFARSTDSGINWEIPIKLSESVHICQGTNIVVSPKNDGTIYVSWRQYAREQQGVPHAIMMCKSGDSGNTFTKATEVALITPFDQYTGVAPGVLRFRTSAFPALAADHQGLVYVAWSERVGTGELGSGRIFITTSKDGITWSNPLAIDTDTSGGHQIMPSLTYAGGKLMMTWYDTRNSGSHSEDFIEGIGQTMDAWVAQAEPSPFPLPSDLPANPVFTDSTQASRYIYVYGQDSVYPLGIYQAQFNYVSFPMFIGGTAPFMGDYLDITPSTTFLYNDQDETWHFNTGKGDFDPTLCHITFACNRDVIPPENPLVPANWMLYFPPGGGDCDDLTNLTTGMRDQNIYTAPITQGIMVGAPINTKPLLFPDSTTQNPTTQKRTFLVFVKNLTDYEKLIRLTIVDPPLMEASFWEFETPPDDECPFEHCEQKEVWVPVLPHSTITLTVFVPAYVPNPYATFRINVEEIDGIGVPTGLRSSIVLNPDPVNTQIIPVSAEYHTPTIISEDPDDLILLYPTVLSAQIYTPELLESSNPDIVTPTPRHPTPRHPTPRHETINHAIRNSSIGDIDISGAQVTDVSWRVTNDGDATSAYSFELIGEIPSVPSQLLIYRVSSTPTSEGCELSELEHHELISSIENPTPRHPTPRHPTPRHNTFFLAPGEEAVITLRLIDPDPPQESGGSTQEVAIMSNGETQEEFDPDFYSKTVAGSVTPQAADPGGNYEVAAGLYIINEFMPDGSVNGRYAATQLKADPETESYSWSLVPGYGGLPPGLELTSDGVIQTEKNPTKGKIKYDPPYDEYDEQNEVYYKTYNFAVQAEDSTGQTAIRSLSIKVICQKCRRRKK